jgi:dinuclear metal center YbgI/SA1388 family protein
MAAVLGTLAEYLDAYLRVREVPDEPNALNGLQVENASGRIARIVAAVDASLQTIEAIRQDGEPVLLLVHHGLFWEGNVALTGRRYRRVRALLERDIALYSAHIPLDVHPQVGNNVLLAQALELRSLEPFDVYRGISIGIQGILDPATPRDMLVGRIDRLLATKSKLLPGGPATCRRIGIISGGAGGRIAAAQSAGLDTYLTGEGAHHTYFDAMELGVNAIYAGHYATETLGVRALAEHLSTRFGIPWEFQDHPTGL